MREIKFRVWKEYEKKMYFVTNINFLMRSFKDNYEAEVDYLGNDNEPYIINDKNTILEQYTGLHDKNGKEIYEGDICKRIRIVSDEYPEQYMPRVPAHPKTREWEVVDIRKITLSPECRLGSELITCRDCLDLEIIGNVHENTELLEEHS